MSTRLEYRMIATRTLTPKNSKSKPKLSRSKLKETRFLSIDKPRRLYVWKPGTEDEEVHMMSEDYCITSNCDGRKTHYKFTFDDDFVIVDKCMIKQNGSEWYGCELWVDVNSKNIDSLISTYWEDIDYSHLNGNIRELRLQGGKIVVV